MKKDFYPDRTICSLQMELKKKYKDLIKEFKSPVDINYISFTIERDRYMSELEEMYKISKSIHYKATRMEKRLLKYRQAIEKLGFKRMK